MLKQRTQRITIIGGTGDQGKGLAMRWAAAGFAVTIGSRDQDRAERAAKDIRASLEHYGITNANLDGLNNADAVKNSPIVVLTVPFAGQIETIKAIKEGLMAGTILIDVTVPLEPAIGGKPTRVLGVWAGSAAEQCAELAPQGIKIVSAFHNVSAAWLQDLHQDVTCDCLVCGDEKDAKAQIKPLVEAINGCRYIDGGPLANSRTVEALTALLIGLNIRYRAHTGIRITGIDLA